ncbi:MAG: acyltransferase family protein [Prevotella sp.]|nr:acyltransferase family protein [Prevotella sp.]
MMIEKQKTRYENIDFMKGICILLVVAAHIDLPLFSYPCFTLFRMPLYYFLSGVFFSKYDGLKTFAIKKSNNLLIPYVFFSVLPIIFLFCYYYLKYLDFLEAYNKAIPLFNAPMWFLVSLFEVGILMFIVSSIKKTTIQISIVMFVSVLGYYMCREGVILPFYLNTALCGSVFYYLGFFLRRYHFIENRSSVVKKFWGTFFIFCLIAFCIIPGKELSLISYKIPFAYIWFLLSGMMGTICLFYFSIIVEKFTPINYLGRYSIIILGTHWYYVKTWTYFLLPSVIGSWWCRCLIFLFAIMLSFPTIDFCKKFIPFFTAQRPLIKIPNNT